MKYLMALAGILFFSHAGAQETATKVIDELLDKYKGVKSYEAKAVIRPDISFLKMLPHKATVYFKQPDKFRMKAEGISILPKQSTDNVFSLLLQKDAYTAVLENPDSLMPAQVTVIPQSDTSDLQLAKLWIDTQRDVITKARLTTKSNGTVFIEYTYDKFAGYGLPDQILFVIDVRKFKIPKAIAADINTETDKDKGKKDSGKPGYIYINISDYQINKQIPDSIFN